VENIDLNDTHWDRIRGYVSESRIDARWVLRQNETDKPLGQLRIVSHPDLPPGHLRAIFTYVISIRKRTRDEKIRVAEDFQMEVKELEVYSINDDTKTETIEYKDLYPKLEEMFGVEIIEKKK
jgi:hypothetical protein